MYTDYYGLNERPFDLTSSPRFLYLGEVHKEALASLVYGVVERKGFMLLTGEAGAGKTTMVHTLLGGLDENVEYVHLSYPLLSADEFVHYIALSTLGKTTPYGSKGAFLIAFGQFLRELRQRQKTFLLIIDEAQGLSLELLEEIRLLSNVETAEEKLINIILVGQPELKERLIHPRCKSLFQRVSVQYHLRPLDQPSVGEYIRTRLRAAGAKNPDKIFPESVIEVVYRYSRGYPREINNISDNVLLLGYVEGKKKITPEMVTEYCEDMNLSPKPHQPYQEAGNLLQTKGTSERSASTRWRRFAFLPLLLIATLGLALGITRTNMIGRIADWMRTDSEDQAASTKVEEDEPVLTVPDISAETTEPPSDYFKSRRENASPGKVRTVTVKAGDTLRELALQVYGQGDPSILGMLKKANPAIKDVNLIVEGQRLVFPPLPVPVNKSDSLE